MMHGLTSQTKLNTNVMTKLTVVIIGKLTDSDKFVFATNQPTIKKWNYVKVSMNYLVCFNQAYISKYIVILKVSLQGPREQTSEAGAKRSFGPFRDPILIKCV